MSTTPKNNSDDQEIDLGAIARKLGTAADRLNTFVYDCIQFVVKNIIIISILILLGVGVGIYLDRTQKIYDHQIIVTPNFGSVDYLYSRVALLDAKIKERDTSFLQSFGIYNASKLAKIEIDPVVDVYNFINRNNNEQNFQLLKLMAEDGDIKKIVEEPTTSKNYTYHAISFTTKDKTTIEHSVEPLLRYLNNNDYFRQIQKEAINNVHLKMKANEQTIAQIDGFLNEFSSAASSGGKSSNLVYYNENTQLNDVIKTKDELVREQGNHRLELISMDRVIKDNTIITNMEHRTAVNSNMKILLPLLLILLFVLFRIFRSFYRSQSVKRAQIV
ncbi:MAG TPA: hypothetical protein VFQ50_02420 [Flavobacterium sp.]|jgi:hypothetical protein|nr:hypothetical protein [Flavobacterium sp.]